MKFRLFGEFTVQRWPDPPWVVVWDPLGFQDEGGGTL